MARKKVVFINGKAFRRFGKTKKISKGKATRFRFRKIKGGKQRLGFRNNELIEITSFKRT